MITLRIWLKHGTDIAALGWMGALVMRARCGRMFLHATHPLLSPLVRELPKEVVREVELRAIIHDHGFIPLGEAKVYTIKSEEVWLDGQRHMTQDVLARGASIREVLEQYFIALQEADVTNTRRPD